MARTIWLFALLLPACSATVQPDLSRLGDSGAMDAASSDIDSGSMGTDAGHGRDAGPTPTDAGADAIMVIPFDAGPPRDVTCTSATPCVCNTGDRCVFHCPTGGCTVDCRTGSMCDVECAGGDCQVTCESASTCTVGCGGPGMCQTQCGRVATCNVMCTTDCQLNCNTRPGCAQTCSGGGCMTSGG